MHRRFQLHISTHMRTVTSSTLCDRSTLSLACQADLRGSAGRGQTGRGSSTSTSVLRCHVTQRRELFVSTETFVLRRVEMLDTLSWINHTNQSVSFHIEALLLCKMDDNVYHHLKCPIIDESETVASFKTLLWSTEERNLTGSRLQAHEMLSTKIIHVQYYVSGKSLR